MHNIITFRSPRSLSLFPHFHSLSNTPFEYAPPIPSSEKSHPTGTDVRPHLRNRTAVNTLQQSKHPDRLLRLCVCGVCFEVQTHIECLHTVRVCACVRACTLPCTGLINNILHFARNTNTPHRHPSSSNIFAVLCARISGWMGRTRAAGRNAHKWASVLLYAGYMEQPNYNEYILGDWKVLWYLERPQTYPKMLNVLVIIADFCIRNW